MWMTTHYTVLGISATASAVDVLQAYERAQASLPMRRLERLLVFLESGVTEGALSEARKVLLDPVARAKYDKILAEEANVWCWPPPC